LVDLKDELTSILRAERRLKPLAEDNFSLNELSMLDKIFDSIFKVLKLAGAIIGGFAILVGMFSVANIMFVSVKERTNIIGIKKALGAKRKVILLEFLIESVVLCVLGGVLGLIAVMGALQIATVFSDFQMNLSLYNISMGLLLSIIVGIIAGVIPAYNAAKMDPVEAIRQG
jgi:putative ABC transport system permease protein